MPIDGEPELWRVERTLELAPGDEVWTLRATVELPEDFVDTAVHVEDPLTGRWGTARVALDGPPAASGLRAAVDEIDEPAPRADEAGAVGSVAAIRLVPPEPGPCRDGCGCGLCPAARRWPGWTSWWMVQSRRATTRRRSAAPSSWVRKRYPGSWR
ncbi:MAG: hypothetical protein R2991_10435 [Thermoanaerobaculia bacterium]